MITKHYITSVSAPNDAVLQVQTETLKCRTGLVENSLSWSVYHEYGGNQFCLWRWAGEILWNDGKLCFNANSVLSLIIRENFIAPNSAALLFMALRTAPKLVSLHTLSTILEAFIHFSVSSSAILELVEQSRKIAGRWSRALHGISWLASLATSLNLARAVWFLPVFPTKAASLVTLGVLYFSISFLRLSVVKWAEMNLTWSSWTEFVYYKQCSWLCHLCPSATTNDRQDPWAIPREILLIYFNFLCRRRTRRRHFAQRQCSGFHHNPNNNQKCVKIEKNLKIKFEFRAFLTTIPANSGLHGFDPIP